MAGLFDTSDVGGPLASSVTPKEGIEGPAPLPSDGPRLFGMAVEAGMAGVSEYSAHKLRKGLQETGEERQAQLQEEKAKVYEDKFKALDFGRKQGMPTAQANARARALKAEALNAVPWAADKINAAYTSFFGGTGSTGFEVDPMEAAALAHQQKVMERAAAGGLSLQDAEMEINLEARNARDEALLQSTQLNQQNAANTFRPVFDNKQNTASMQVNIITRSLMPEGQSTLQPEQMAAAKSSISTLANQMRMELRAKSQTSDGRSLLEESTFKGLMADIDHWETKEKELLGDRDYLTTLRQIEEMGDLRATMHARELFYSVHVLDKGTGQAGVSAYFSGLQNPAYVANLVERLPALAKFVDPNTGQFQEVGATAFNSLLGVPEANDLIKGSENYLRNGGAHLATAMLADRKMLPVFETSVKQVGSEEEGVAQGVLDTYRDIGEIDPQGTAKMLAGPFPGLESKYPEESWKILVSSMNGMSQNVSSAIFRSGQAIPDYIKVIPSKHPDSRTFSLSTDTGEELPDSAKSVIAHQYAVLRNRPLVVDKFERSLGVPLTPEDVLEIFINNKVPDRLVEIATKGEKFEPYSQRMGLTQGGSRKRPMTEEEAARAREASMEELKAFGDAAKKYGPTPSNIKEGAEKAFEFSKTMTKKLWDFRRAVQERISAPPEPITAGTGLIAGTPEESITTVTNLLLTEEQAASIRNAATLEEKKALAIEYGIPKELVEKATRGR